MITENFNKLTKTYENKKSLLTSGNVDLIYFIGLFICWMLPGLIGHEPWKPDEAYSFGLILHIYQTGDWVVPTLAGEPFMEKPPIYYVISALMVHLLSPLLSLPDAARLASGIFMIITCSAITGAARLTFEKGYGRWAAVVFLSCLGLCVRSHQMITDTALLAGCSLGLFGLIASEKRCLIGGVYLAIGAAFAFLAKGLLGPGILGLTVFFAVLLFKQCRKKDFFIAIIVASLIFISAVTPWLYALWQRSPELFLTWLWDNNLGRFFGANDLGPKKGHFFYLYTLPWYAFPALPLVFYYLYKKKNEMYSFGLKASLLYFIITFFVLSASSDARELYALPMLPPLAIIASGIAKNLRMKKVSTSVIILTVFFALVLWAIGLLFAFGSACPWFIEVVTHYLPGFNAEFNPNLIFSALAATLFICLALMQGLKKNMPDAYYFFCIITLVWSCIMTLGLPAIDYSKRYSDVFLSLKPYLKGNECLVSKGLGEPQRAMVEYYTGIKTKRVEMHGMEHNCSLLLLQTSISSPSENNEDILWKGHRPADDDEFYILYKLTAKTKGYLN
ncbi:ArnT family glycosyltransferase [Pantoea sp. FN0307]|uniref:ArnT family glycosyltransferase n=1 Tax=unclassified Pantoea TaxID=2630326 RepID=UPI003CF66338